MEAKFDLYHWDNIKGKLKNLYPQLTDADLIWRHETMDSLYNSIATKLVISKKAFSDIVAAL